MSFLRSLVVISMVRMAALRCGEVVIFLIWQALGASWSCGRGGDGLAGLFALRARAARSYLVAVTMPGSAAGLPVRRLGGRCGRPGLAPCVHQ
jgi:hypothetical protein